MEQGDVIIIAKGIVMSVVKGYGNKYSTAKQYEISTFRNKGIHKYEKYYGYHIHKSQDWGFWSMRSPYIDSEVAKGQYNYKDDVQLFQ